MALFDSLFGVKKRKAAAEAELEKEKAEKHAQQVAKETEAHKDFAWPGLSRLNVFVSKDVEMGTIQDPLTPERKAEIGPMIFEPELKPERFHDLTLQEILFLETSTALANHAAPLEHYESIKQSVHNAFLNRLRSAEKLYAIYDSSCGYPLIDSGFVLVYLEKDHAEKASELYNQQNRRTQVVELPGLNAPQQEDTPTQMKFFDYLYFMGAENIMIDNGWYKGFVKRSEISAPFYINNPEPEKIPPYNPGLNFVLTDYIEELRWHVKYEKRDAILRQKFQRIMSMIPKANFIMPVRNIPAEEGSSGENAENRIQIPMVRLNDKNLLPVFSDMFEFSKKFANTDYKPTRASFQSLEKFMPNYDGFIVNPNGQGLVVEKRPKPENGTPSEQAQPASDSTQAAAPAEAEKEASNVIKMSDHREQ